VLASCVLVALVLAAAGESAGARGVSGCSPASITKPWNGDRTAPEVFGTKRVALRALFFLAQGAAWSDPSYAVFTGLVGNQVKIAWGMKGRGRFRINAVGPTGQRLRPVWGPEKHSGGNWIHPGGEWGTGWVFPTAGCWRVHAVRGPRSGSVWLSLQ
jgi:hypothetical protein